MAALTKTQINYFTDRMKIVTNRLIGKFEEECKAFLPKPMMVEEKVHLLLSGKAEPNYEYLSKRKNDFNGLGYVNEAFTFPGECEMKNKAEKGELDRKAFVEYIKKVRESICDDFVIGKITDPDVVVLTFEDRLPVFVAEFRHKYGY